MSDEKILLAIKNRDEGAMAAVMQRYSGLLWKIAAAVLVNAASVQDVEECVADVFIYFWLNPDKFNPEKGKLVSWLSMIARTKAIDRYRQAVRKQEVAIEEQFLTSQAELLSGVVDREEKEKLRSCLNRLEEPDREMILRRYFYDQKPKEIAVALNISKKQVENCLYQTKKKLRKMLQE